MPGSGKPLFRAASANLNPRTEAKVDTKNPEREPLLIIVGEKDHTVPPAVAKASYNKQRRDEGVTEYVLALDANCLAYGVDLSLAQLLFINTTASALSSLIPVPGGIGAAEAALSGGLIAMGVDTSTAFAVAITHRLCTFYLPPIWGYFSLQWLRRRGYV